MPSRIPTENQLPLLDKPLAVHGVDCSCCPRDDGSDARDWDHADMLADDLYLSPLPVAEVEELDLCLYCGSHFAVPCDVPPADICERAIESAFGGPEAARSTYSNGGPLRHGVSEGVI